MRKADFERLELQSPKAQARAAEKRWDELYSMMCSLCSQAGIEVASLDGSHAYIATWCFLAGIKPDDFDSFAIWLNSRRIKTDDHADAG